MITAAVAILTGPGVASATPINDLSTVPTRASQTMVSEETGQHDALFIGNDGFAAGAQTVVAETAFRNRDAGAPISPNQENPHGFLDPRSIFGRAGRNHLFGKASSAHDRVLVSDLAAGPRR